MLIYGYADKARCKYCTLPQLLQKMQQLNYSEKSNSSVLRKFRVTKIYEKHRK
jgi:hypothetical protein